MADRLFGDSKAWSWVCLGGALRNSSTAVWVLGGLGFGVWGVSDLGGLGFGFRVWGLACKV